MAQKQSGQQGKGSQGGQSKTQGGKQGGKQNMEEKESTGRGGSNK